MADVVTSVYEFTEPEVGSSDNTWGTKLNANWAKMEALLVSGFDDGTDTDIGNLKGSALAATITGNHAFSGTITFENTGPYVEMHESDQTDPDGWYRFYASNTYWVLSKRTSAGSWATEDVVLRVRPDTTPKRLEAVAYEFMSSGMLKANGGTLIIGEDSNQAIRFKPGTTTSGVAALMRTDSVNLYFMMTDSGDADGSYNSMRPLYINKTTGIVGMQQGLYLPSAGGGITFGNKTGSSYDDLSSHIALYGSSYGFNVTASTLNFSIPTSSSFKFYAGTTLALTLNSSYMTIGTFTTSNGDGNQISDNSIAISASTAGSSSFALCQFWYGTDRRFMVRRDGLIDAGAYYINATDAGGVANYISRKTGGSFYCMAGVNTSAMFQVRDSDNNITLRVEPDDSTIPATTTAITRRKGDVRYTMAPSSLRYKDELVLADEPLPGFMELDTYWWTWGKELYRNDPRFGKPGFGLIAEHVANVLPAAVKYDSKGRPDGLEALPLIAALHAEVKMLRQTIYDLLTDGK